MKKILKASNIVAALIVLAVALVITNFAFAQTAVDSSSDTSTTASTITLESKLDKLIESQTRLSEAFEKALITEEPAYPENATLTYGDDMPRARCTQDFQQWPSSHYYKQSDWDNTFIPSSSVSYFTDINGDGLVDYAYSNNSGSSNADCIYLNNGNGWDRVFKCYEYYDLGGTYTWTFYGDCADTTRS